MKPLLRVMVFIRPSSFEVLMMMMMMMMTMTITMMMMMMIVPIKKITKTSRIHETIFEWRIITCVKSEHKYDNKNTST